jgi:Ca2+-binding RTX toxin-like protein
MGAYMIDGVAGADGADGVNPGDAGQDGEGGGDASLVLTSDDALNTTQMTISGGAGGRGGEAAAGAPGGAGGDGGTGGDALAAIDGIRAYDAGQVIRQATAYGGNTSFGQASGGWGGDADPDTSLASDAGAGGDGGDGGAAHARVSGVLAYITGSGGSYVSLRANATGGAGGFGGLGGYAGQDVDDHPVSAPNGLNGDGGAATAELLNATVVGGAGADLIDIGSAAAGGSSALDDGGGLGGQAVEAFTGNVVRTGAGADDLYIYASAVGGRSSGPGAAVGADGGIVPGADYRADATLTFSGNIFDAGADNDVFHVTLIENFGEVTVAGNTFLGGGGDDVLTFRGDSGLGSRGVDFDLRDNRVRGIDRIIGSDSRDHITGASRSDRIDGADGWDKLVGGAGDDTLSGGLGNDHLKGSGGYDVVSFEGSAAGVVVDLVAGTATGEGTDGLKGFENVIGSAHDDVIRDGAWRGELKGGAGDDTLIGGGGADTLRGGEGADRFVYDAAADSVHTSPGSTDIIYAFETGIDRVDLAAIDADETTGADDAFTFSLGGPSGAPQIGVLYVDSDAVIGAAQADTDGDGSYDLEITFAVSGPLSATDFVL